MNETVRELTLTDEQVRAIQPDDYEGTPAATPWEDRRHMAEFKAGLYRERTKVAEEKREKLVDRMADFLDFLLPDTTLRLHAEELVDIIRDIAQD